MFEVSAGMVIPNNLSTHNDISIPIMSLKNLHYWYCMSYFGAIPVKYVCGYGDPAFAALVPLKNYIIGMGSVTSTVRGITGNIMLWVW